MRKLIAISISPPTPSEIRRIGPKTKTIGIDLPDQYKVLGVQPEAGGGSIILFLSAPEEQLHEQDKWGRELIVLKQNGDTIDDSLRYVGTVQIASAAYTWHVYIQE